MKRLVLSWHHVQAGHSLLLTLIVLAFGSLLLVPSLQLMYSSAKAGAVYEESLLDQYTAGSGVEDVLGRLKFEAGFADSINASNPVLEYSISANARQADMTVEYVDQSSGEPREQGPQAWRIEISKTADPSTAVPGQRLTISYTITVRNVGTSTIHLIEVGDRLPEGFQDILYVAGSAAGISSDPPEITVVDGRTQLRWDLGEEPGYRVDPDTTHLQQFQVTVTVMWDVYLNLAWVIAKPNSIGYVSTGDTAPVEGARLFDVTSVSGGSRVNARVGLATDGRVTIVSWQVP